MQVCMFLAFCCIADCVDSLELYPAVRLFSFVSRAEHVIKLTGNWLLQNSDMFWKPAIAVQADVGSTISALTAALKGYRCDPDWVYLLRSRDEETEKKNR